MSVGPLERVEELEEQLAELEKLVYVPGLWKCAKCNLSIVATVLHAADGHMAADTKPQQCPNGCGPMWRVTERSERQNAQRAFNELFDRFARGPLPEPPGNPPVKPV